jgi:hypothetical protein
MSSKHFTATFFILVFLSSPFFVQADYLAQQTRFYIEPSYDTSSRTEITATCQIISGYSYIYIENSWWNSLEVEKKNKYISILKDLTQEFDSKIYSELTSYFGSEWKPGIDNDEKITILIHPMKRDIKGYFRNSDEYLKNILPASNQREMIYLNSSDLDLSYLPACLAHEFMHLIVFNQKERQLGTSEETWLSEAYSEYAPNYLGYLNSSSEYLKSRIQNFLSNPSDSLVDWQGVVDDYGIINSFFTYLTDEYGSVILKDALQTDTTGIASLDYALKKNKIAKTFSQIFQDWAIAVYLNDCSVSNNYCFKNVAWQGITILPFNNFLPYSGQSTLALTRTLKNYSCQWQKFTGGNDDLKIEISSSDENFSFYYLLQNKTKEAPIEIAKMRLTAKEDGSGRAGQIVISDFGSEFSSITIVSCYANPLLAPSSVKRFTYSISAISGIDQEVQPFHPQPGSLEAMLPFPVSKPLAEMSYRELLIVLIQLLLSRTA